MTKIAFFERKSDETVKRTAVRTITYRVLIMILDFVAVYLLSGKTSVAIGYTIISNLYTTVAYFFHERIWDKISWGLTSSAKH